MKILYDADLHGDLELLKIIRDFAKEQKDFDVEISSGDLVGPFFNKGQVQNLDIATQILFNIKAQNQFNNTLEEIAKKLQGMKECQDEVRKAAKTYLELNQIAKPDAIRQYEQIKELFDSFEMPVFTLPGNWDLKNINDYLGRENLHNKCLGEVNNTTFAGYGGSYESMIGILPLDMQLPFSSEQAYNFLSKQDADVALVHVPPYGICDIKEDNKNIGDLGILAYLFRENPNLVLVGHTHRMGIQDAERNGKTIVINPGNLGRYSIYKGQENPGPFGTFVEINLDEQNYFKDATFYQITDIKKGKESIAKLAKFQSSDKGVVNTD